MSATSLLSNLNFPSMRIAAWSSIRDGNPAASNDVTGQSLAAAEQKPTEVINQWGVP
jgi:hypothetical protein